MPFRRVDKSSAGDQVLIQLKELILGEEWKQGEKLPSENSLADAMGVSRTTIRGALQKLTALGLVETRTGEGTFVRELKPGMLINNVIPAAYLGENALLEVMEFRCMIEGAMAESACKAATADDILTLEKIYGLMQAGKDNFGEFSRRDFEFHREIGRITQNSLVIETYRVLEDLLVSAMEKIVCRRGNARGLYYHALLIDTMKSGDSLKSGEIMREHVAETYDSIIAFMNGNNSEKKQTSLF